MVALSSHVFNFDNMAWLGSVKPFTTTSARHPVGSRSARIRHDIRRLRPILTFLFWSIAFGIAFTQWPLFSENQHTKFLQGLARAGVGRLEKDWLANTIDPLPAFSAIVFVTAKYLPSATFYLYHALLLGLYIFSLTGIAEKIFQLDRTRAGRLLFMVVVIALHSGLLPPFSMDIMGNSLGWLLQSGVAGQYLFNPVFQPSTFGVLLIFSIFLFLVDRPFWAAVIAATAALLHSTYLPSAAVLTSAYVLLTYRRERNIVRAGGLGLTALAVVTPVLLYNFLLLGPTDPLLWAQSQAIIVDERIPHHSLPAVWMNGTVWVKLGIVLMALWVVRKSALFAIMAWALGAAVGLTLLQVQTGWDTLAFIAPWRISAFLVPPATCMLLAAAIALMFRYAQLSFVGEAVAIGLSLLLLAATVSRGYIAIWDSFEARWNDSINKLYDFVISDAVPGDVYMVPVGMYEFRLSTDTAVVVTWKSHPYKDTEVIEWKRRVDAVNAFYGEPFCHRAGEMHHEFSVTHILFEHENPLADCPIVEPVYNDGRFFVLEVQ